VPDLSPSAKRRRRVPLSVRDEVLREAGYMCGNPRCRHILTLELHHMVWVKDDGGNQATNLLALCPNCHALHTQGYIPDTAIRHWKGTLHALNYAFSKESMDLLLFLHQMQAATVWYTGDGVLRFAALIAAGLARVAETQVAGGVVYASKTSRSRASTASSAHRVGLTEKGLALVDAWLAGDEEAYLRALQTTGS